MILSGTDDQFKQTDGEIHSPNTLDFEKEADTYALKKDEVNTSRNSAARTDTKDQTGSQDMSIQ